MAQSIFYQVLLAGVLGLVGQLIRMAIGLVKLNQEAKQKGLAFADMFIPARLMISLLIGFAAGVLAWAIADKVLIDGLLSKDTETIKKFVLTMIAAGYAGTDFIEGTIGKLIPKSLAPGAGSVAPPVQTT